MGRSIDVYQESLESAVERYHVPYDAASATQEDPLLYFGAVSGELPGVDLELTLVLRDAVIRYFHPHRNFLWERLSDLIQNIAQQDAGGVLIVPIADPRTKERLWGLTLQWLSKMAHAVVAVDQILDALGAFLGRKPSTRFVMDPGFKFTYMLERCISKAEIRFAFTTLQLRLERADVHIRSQLKSIRKTLTGELSSDHVSSIDSTISEVRELFGRDSPSKELYRLLSRPDY
ncbi:hypothetical protein FB451DRAFT_1042144, partial [Mycena latifolia]